MKTEFIYFQTKKHFKTILLTCNLAILIYHILEQKLNADDFHFTTREILDALNGMNLFKLKDV